MFQYQLNSIVRTNLCDTVQSCTMYIAITITIIALFVILITQLFVRSLHRRSSNYDCFVHTQLDTRLIEFILIVVCFVLFFYCPTLYISRTKVLQNSIGTTCSLYISILVYSFFPHSCCCCQFNSNVFDVFANTHCQLLLSLSLRSRYLSPS